MMELFLCNVEEWVKKNIPFWERKWVFSERLIPRQADMITNPVTLLFGVELFQEMVDVGLFLETLQSLLRRKKIAKIVFLSSYGVYAPSTDKSTETDPAHPKTLLGVRSFVLESFLEFLSTRYQIPAVVLRVFNLYGPHQPIPYLVPKVLSSLISKETLGIGDVEKVRDFLFISDFWEAVKRVLSMGENRFQVFNLGSGEGHSIRSLIDVAQKVCGKKSELLFDASMIREEWDYDFSVADTTKIQRKLEWTPQVSLEEGIRLTYSWQLGRSGK